MTSGEEEFGDAGHATTGLKSLMKSEVKAQAGRPALTGAEISLTGLKTGNTQVGLWIQLQVGKKLPDLTVFFQENVKQGHWPRMGGRERLWEIQNFLLDHRRKSIT